MLLVSATPQSLLTYNSRVPCRKHISKRTNRELHEDCKQACEHVIHWFPSVLPQLILQPESSGLGHPEQPQSEGLRVALRSFETMQLVDPSWASDSESVRASDRPGSAFDAQAFLVQDYERKDDSHTVELNLCHVDKEQKRFLQLSPDGKVTMSLQEQPKKLTMCFKKDLSYFEIKFREDRFLSVQRNENGVEITTVDAKQKLLS
eukprot:g83468.t1